MQSCERVPTTKTPAAVNCLEILLDEYTFIHRIGDETTGTASLVFKLNHVATGREVVVKVMPVAKDSGAVNDVSTACLLNSISGQTAIFVQTTGWLMCDTIPPSWLAGQRVFLKKKTGRYLFQVMTYSPYAWSNEDIQLSLEEYRMALFLLIHGLWVAWKLRNFRHNDIHRGQILFQPCPRNTVLSVAVDDVVFEIPCERFIPKLIDFGYATLGGDDEGGQSESESSQEDDSLFEKENQSASFSNAGDIKDLLNVFQERTPFVFSTWKTAQSAKDLLLKDPLFAGIRKKYTPTAAIRGLFCVGCCAAPATHQFKTKDKGSLFVFCGQQCALVWNPIFNKK